MAVGDVEGLIRKGQRERIAVCEVSKRGMQLALPQGSTARSRPCRLKPEPGAWPFDAAVSRRMAPVPQPTSRTRWARTRSACSSK